MNVARLLKMTALLVAGFAAGNAIADRTVAEYRDLTLSRALARLHQDYKADTVSIDFPTARKTVRVPVGKPYEMVATLARPYGARTVDIGRITVVLDPVPSASSAGQQVTAADNWLQRQPLGKALESVEIRRAGDATAERLVPKIGAGPTRFTDLPSEDQRLVLDMLRAINLNHRSGMLRSLLKANS